MTPLNWHADHLALFEPVAAANPFGPLSSPTDVLQGSFLYQVEAGEAAGLLAVRPLQLAHGNRLDVVGGVALTGRNQAGAIGHALDVLALQFDADVVSFCTQRAHLVRQASRLGFEVSGLVMTKRMHRVRQ